MSRLRGHEKTYMHRIGRNLYNITRHHHHLDVSLEHTNDLLSRIQGYITLVPVYRTLNIICNYPFAVTNKNAITCGTMSIIMDKDNQEMPFASNSQDPQDFQLDFQSKYYFVSPTSRNTVPELNSRCFDMLTGERVNSIPFIPKSSINKENYPTCNSDNNSLHLTTQPIIVTITAGASGLVKNPSGTPIPASGECCFLTLSHISFFGSACKVDSPSYLAISRYFWTRKQLSSCIGTLTNNLNRVLPISLPQVRDNFPLNHRSTGIWHTSLRCDTPTTSGKYLSSRIRVLRYQPEALSQKKHLLALLLFGIKLNYWCFPIQNHPSIQ